MILSYNWQILESFPNNLEELQKLVKIPVPQQQEFFGPDSPSNTIQPISLRLPLFGFIFNYYIEQPKTNQPELELTAELGLLEETVALKVMRQMRAKNCIFLELLVQSSEVHEVLLALTVRVKYHPGIKPGKINSIDSLVRLAGNRQLNLYSATTYATIRKELMIDSPVTIQHRAKDGYLLLRLIRNEDSSEEVEITAIELMNWLAVGNEALKREVVVGLLTQGLRLKAKETYALPFKLESSLVGVEMPVSVSYRYPPELRVFKMVKTIRGESSD